MALNAVTRGDLRARATSPKVVSILTVYLSVLAALAFLSLPPDLGRLDDLRGEGLLVAFLVAQMVLAAYLTSAPACGEIAVDGEKSVWDLAASPFRGTVIARGKLLTSLVFAAMQFALAAPFAVIVAGIRGEPLAVVLRAAVVAVPAAALLGALGALYSVAFDADFARSFVHWATLLALLVGAMALPAPWDLLSPVRALVAAVRDGLGVDVLGVIGLYAVIASLAAAATARRVEAIRAQARAAARPD